MFPLWFGGIDLISLFLSLHFLSFDVHISTEISCSLLGSGMTPTSLLKSVFCTLRSVIKARAL